MLPTGARVHFIGIGGTGLSAIATVLLEQGYRVSGCDQAESPLGRALADRGARVWLGHDPAHLEDVDAVVVTSAAAADHPEVAAARARGLPVLKRADFLGALMADKVGIAVAGTHGKTTTTAMISFVLVRAQMDPTFIVGGTLQDLGVNARAGAGEAFVIEADEYDHMFLGLLPKVAVVTNIEHDHPDIYPSYADLRAAFTRFVGRLPKDGLLAACAEDDGSRSLAEEYRAAGGRVLLYGFERGNWQARDVHPNGVGGMDALVQAGNNMLGRVRLRVPGRHNVLNALATMIACEYAGLSFNPVRQALGEFHGVGRRFEVRGEAGGVTVIDDYGHHPTEIRNTLAAARARYPQRTIWAVWQPHTYSRTRALLDEFAGAFGDADHVLVTDIYASREHDTLGVSAGSVIERMRHPDARAGGSLDAVAEDLLARLRPGDVLIVFSAGDATKVSEKVLEARRRGTQSELRGNSRGLEGPGGVRG